MRQLFNNILYGLIYRWNAINRIRISGNQNVLEKKGRMEGVDLLIQGNNNKVIIGHEAVVQYTTIKILGDNHTIVFGQQCDIQKNEIWLQGKGNELIVGDFTMVVHSDIAVGETATKIVIGKHCMVAGELRTSDGHTILNDQQKRVNYAEDITIGDNVWVCKGSMVLKGVEIGEGSMIAARSIVTKDIPSKSMAAGAPAKVIRENIGWKRELIS
jgi:acetyltransferase-like isoleucine patch superfamily enzyme